MEEYIVRVEKNGEQRWLNKDGFYHRLDGPAIVWADGCQEWRVNGDRHREDGPAITCPDGYQEYWVDGEKVDPPSKVKEVTMKELQGLLGYEVKIVKD